MPKIKHKTTLKTRKVVFFCHHLLGYSMSIAVVLVCYKPHDSPVFRKHLWSNQDPEDSEDMKKEVLQQKD